MFLSVASLFEIEKYLLFSSPNSYHQALLRTTIPRVLIKTINAKTFDANLSCFTCQKPASTYHQTQPMEKCIVLILHGTQYARLNVMMDSHQRENMLSSTNTTQSQESGKQRGKSFPGPTACSVSTTLSQCFYLRLCRFTLAWYLRLLPDRVRFSLGTNVNTAVFRVP